MIENRLLGLRNLRLTHTSVERLTEEDQFPMSLRNLNSSVFSSKSHYASSQEFRQHLFGGAVVGTGLH